MNEEVAEEILTDTVKEFRSEVKAWITKFDTTYKEATRLMSLPMSDEKLPFKEKYEARELLENMLKEVEGKQEWLDQSQLVRCAKALMFNKLGTNYYDAEEISASEKQNQQALSLWLTASKGLQLRFSQ